MFSVTFKVQMFLVASGGFHEVERHVERKKHKELATGMATQSIITAFFERTH